MKKVRNFIALSALLVAISGCSEDVKMTPPSTDSAATSSSAPSTTDALTPDLLTEDDQTLACRMTSQSFKEFLKAYSNITGQSGIKTTTSEEYLLSIKTAKEDLTLVAGLIEEPVLQKVSFAKQSLNLLENSSITQKAPTDGEVFFISQSITEFVELCKIS